jgi:plastocyanin
VRPVVRRVFIAALVIASVGLLAAPAQAAADITIQNFAFSPTPFATTEGSSVIWQNDDLADHTATSNRRQFFNTGTITEGGGQGTATIDAAGTFGYHCTFHSSMHGIVRAPIVLGVSSTTVGTGVAVIAATADASSSFTYDYERKFATGSWIIFKTMASSQQIQFTPKKAGTFRFRSRVYNSKGKPSGWSPSATLTVSAM